MSENIEHVKCLYDEEVEFYGCENILKPFCMNMCG